MAGMAGWGRLLVNASLIKSLLSFHDRQLILNTVEFNKTRRLFIQMSVRECSGISEDNTLEPSHVLPELGLFQDSAVHSTLNFQNCTENKTGFVSTTVT